MLFMYVFVMISHLFIAALWSPEGKGLTSWLVFVICIVILLLSYLVSWDRCGTLLYRFLFLLSFLLCLFAKFNVPVFMHSLPFLPFGAKLSYYQ